MMAASRILHDNKGRVPFAIVAVLILLLSIFSTAYLSGIQKREASRRLISAEVDRQTSLLHEIEDSMGLEAYYLATDAVVSSTQILCNQSMLDAIFQENYSAYLSQRFPTFLDPYSIEVGDFKAQVFLEERSLHDLIESNETTGKEVQVEDQEGNVASEETEVLETIAGETYNETAAIARFVVVGHGNCTVRNGLSGSAMERPISFEKAIDSPFPLMNSKLLELGAEGESNAMSLARITKYVLSTIAQYRVLQGFGSGLGNAPGDTNDILTTWDVQLAVNFAILLETARIFRGYDADLASGIDIEYPDSGAGSMCELIGKYLNTGTLDPADIVALYMGIDKEQLPIDMIISQAVNAVIDQFVLKYLDYFGIADIANSIYRGIQKLGRWIEDAGKKLSAFIFGDDGEARKEVEQVTNFISKLMMEASQAPSEAHWPPDSANVTNPRLLLSPGNISVTNLSVFDVLEPIDERFTYMANCSQLQNIWNETVLDADSQVIGTRYNLALLYRNVTALTQRSADTPSPLGFFIDFPQASMLRSSPEMNDTWLYFYDNYYEASEDIIYDTIRDMVKNVSAEIATLLTMFIRTKDLSLASYKNGTHAINPKDTSSTLQSVKDVIDEVLRDTIAYIQQNPGNINAMIGALADKHSQLTFRFMEFVNINYDTIVDKNNAMLLGRESLVNSLLGNASVSIDSGYPASRNYTLYNDLGHQRGFVDEQSVQYNCTSEPDRRLQERLIAEQNSANMSTNLQPYLDHSYSVLKDAEVKFDYFGSEVNGMMLKALEGTVKTQQTRVSGLFTGMNQKFGLITMAGDFITKVTSGIIWSGEVANTQYCPTIFYSDGNGPIQFDFYEGNYSSAKSSGGIRYDGFEVNMPGGFLTAIDPGYAMEPDQVPFGFLATNISEPKGLHYTDITSFNERPFETSWNVTVSGRFEIFVNSKSLVYLGNGTHELAVANNTIEINLDIPIIVYSGWNLANVEYDSTSTLAGDVKKVLDIIGEFLKWVWGALTAPIDWIIDQVMKVVNFFSDIIGTLLSYAAKVVNLLVDIIGCLVGLVQWFMKSIAKLILSSIVKWIIDILPDDVSFEFSMFGFTFNITFAPSSAIQQADEGENAVLMSIRTVGRLFGLGFDIGLQLCALSEEIADRIGLDYDVLLWSVIDLFGFFTLETRVDPFMATSEHVMEIHGDGETWGLDIVIPEVEVYDSVQYSLQDIPGIGQALSNIPIPFLGVEASVNAGLTIQYTMKGLEADNVVINEVECNPRGWDTGNDWIELYNPTEEKVNLTGWVIGSRTHPIVNRTLLPDATIEPEGYYKIQYENFSIPDINISYQLLDPGGVVVDSTPLLSESNNTTVQGTPIDALGSHKTWQRTPNGANLSIAGEWRFSNCTPRSENAGMNITFRDVVRGLLKTAFNNTWKALKDEAAFSLTFVATLVKEFIKRFVDDVLTVVEKCVLNTILFIDVQLKDMSGSFGGGISLSFVIEGGDTLRNLLEWVIGSLAVFLAKIGKASQPSQYPKLAEGVPEHLYIRLDVYAFVKVPGVFRKLADKPEELGTVKVGARIEANIPALAALIGKNMGRWQINFGVYIENLPAQIADQLFGTGEDVTPNVWIMKGMVYEK
jgi:hypothetical protein